MGNKTSCIFCDIVNNKTEQLLFENEDLAAFNDISLKGARMHILVVPKKHIKNIDNLTKEQIPLVQSMKEVAI